MLDAEIATRLRAVVERVSPPIDDAARALIARLLDVAVERLQHAGVDEAADEAADETAVVAATAALQALVDDMTQQVRILRFDAIHAPNVVDALARLRPSWPFCGEASAVLTSEPIASPRVDARHRHDTRDASRIAEPVVDPRPRPPSGP